MARTQRGKAPPRRPEGALPPLATLLDSPPGRPEAPPGWRIARSLAMCMLAAWLGVTALTSLVLHSGGVVAQGNETTWDRAIFTAINTSTLTGFQQTMGVREMRAAGTGGPLLLLALTLAGSFMTLTLGGLAACRALRMPHTVPQILWAAATSILLTTLGGAAALIGAAGSVFEALFQATCAFGNSGLWLGDFPTTVGGATYLVLLPLVILGGLGLPVIIEVSDRLFGGPPLSRHSRVVLTLTGTFYIGALLALVLAQVSAAWGGGWPAWHSTLASCSVAAINTRSAGLPFQSPAAFTPAGQWILMLLMLVGASPAGTASGVKTTTLWQLCRGIRGMLRGSPVPRIVGIAAVWLFGFALMLIVGILLLASLEPQLSPDRLLFLACSAVGNVGLSHDPVSTTGPGLLVLSALMLAGRLAPLAVLWWIAETTGGVDVVVG